MSKRTEIINDFYKSIEEDSRLNSSRQGQLEYLTTMTYIHRYLSEKSKVLEIGAGTGRYSIALAQEGYEVKAVEFVKENIEVLKKNIGGLKNIEVFQGDAVDLSRFRDNSFDITLLLGPMYHLYDESERHKALDEAIRVTKTGGIIFVAFLSVHGILYSNYLQGNMEIGIEENFDENYGIKHYPEQLFTGYDITDFEDLFSEKNVEHITTIETDSILELAEQMRDFKMSDYEFEKFFKYHLHVCEKRELLGSSNHLLYICKKRNCL